MTTDLTAYAESLVAAFEPLTTDQRDRLAALLRALPTQEEAA